jgi:Tub family
MERSGNSGEESERGLLISSVEGLLEPSLSPEQLRLNPMNPVAGTSGSNAASVRNGASGILGELGPETRPRAGVTLMGEVSRERFCVFDRFAYRPALSDRALLTARRTGNRWGIFNEKELMGVVESNFLGTRYKIKRKVGESYKEVVYVEYKNNLYGSRGPRTFKVCMDREAGLAGAKSLTERVRDEERESYVTLVNKRPIYNPGSDSYMLNFNGRVTLPSVKNFQLIHPDDALYITLMFGKTGENEFVLDYTYPWNAFEAFGIGVASLVFKIGCE